MFVITSNIYIRWHKTSGQLLYENQTLMEWNPCTICRKTQRTVIDSFYQHELSIRCFHDPRPVIPNGLTEWIEIEDCFTLTAIDFSKYCKRRQLRCYVHTREWICDFHEKTSAKVTTYVNVDHLRFFLLELVYIFLAHAYLFGWVILKYKETNCSFRMNFI